MGNFSEISRPESRVGTPSTGPGCPKVNYKKVDL
jgi:hypothetical protein